MENKHIFWYYWVLLTLSDFFSPLFKYLWRHGISFVLSPSPTDWLIDWSIGPFCNKKEKMYYAMHCLWYFSNLTFLLLRKVIIEICFWVCHFWIKVRKNVIEYKSKNASFKSILNIHFSTRSFFSTRGKWYVNNLVFVIIWQGYCDSKTAWYQLRKRNRINFFNEFYCKFLA